MARASRSGFAQMNRLKAGSKGGSGQVGNIDEMFPVDIELGDQPDKFGVVGADARDQNAENVNGAFKGVSSGAVTFPPKE